MLKKELGKTGVMIPEIGLGTWQYRNGEQPLRLGVSLGANLIDTAEMYGTEEIVGRSIEGIREQVFVATKVSAEHLHYENVIRAAEASMRRLKIKTIDLYQIHWPNPRIPISETMKAMEELVKRGMIRYIGISNFSASETQEAQEALSSERIVSNQVQYNLDDREIENDLIPYCKSEKITIIAYSPLSRGGILAVRSKKGALLDEIGKKYQKSRSQVVLNWITSRDPVVAIPKADNLDHIREDCGASGWRLGHDDIRKIDEES